VSKCALELCESSQACVDLGAKIIYSASLYWTNLLSFERFDLVKAISEATDFNDPDQAAKAQDRISSLQVLGSTCIFLSCRFS
jgi:hypothetical protein